MSAFIQKIGIDLGTTYTLVHLPKKGIVLNEPSVVAVSSIDGSILAVGDEAKEMIGRTPDTIIAKRPLKDGVIADYKITEAMLRYFIAKAAGPWRFFKPEVMVAVPAGITSTERRAVIDAALAAGSRSVYILKEPIAAAIGAGIPIASSQGHMIVNIGGGTSEIAVISLGSLVTASSIRIGGNKLDQAIIEHVRRKYALAIGERMAEQVKIGIGSAQYLSEDEKLRMDIRGRDLVSGLPRTIELSSDDVTEAIQGELEGIVQAVKNVFQITPPELSADVIENGITLSGGTSMLRHLASLMTSATGVATEVANDPQLCVARGTGIALDNLEDYKRSLSAGGTQ